MYSDGKSVTEIARELGRSRQWVHKWIRRSKSKNSNWNKSASKMPHGPHNRTPHAVEADVIRARQELESAPYMESGAYAIWHKLRDEGGAPPSVATINRILNRNGLIDRKTRYRGVCADYPVTPPDTQIMDLIGPRYIHGGSRYYLFTIISNDTRHAGVYPILTKDGNGITDSAVRFWKEYSLPCFLQMDNELSFKGSNRHPRSLGLLLRTAMGLNVVPIFIPVREPWRDGVIERFNQKVERTLLAQEHRDFEELKEHTCEFVSAHNRWHHYSTLDHKTPVEMDSELPWPLNPLAQDYQVTSRPVLNEANLNEIRFIRLVRSDLTVSILNSEIHVRPELMYTYVEARLLVNQNRLLIIQDDKVVQDFDFLMPSV